MKCLNSSISVILCLFLKVLCWLKMVKNLPAMQETWVRTLGQEASLENSMDRGAWLATVHEVVLKLVILNEFKLS